MLKIHRETFIIIVSKILSIFHKEPFRPKELLKHIDYNMTTMYRVLCVLRSYPTVCTYDEHTKKYQLLITDDITTILEIVSDNISTCRLQHIRSFKRIQKIFEHFLYHSFTIQRIQTYLNLPYNTTYRILTRFQKKYPDALLVNETEQQHVFKFNAVVKEIIY